MQNIIGFGCPDFTFAVYIANRPSMVEYSQLNTLMPMMAGEIESINQACGNGWRKVFNVYAKVLFALSTETFNFQRKAESWQQYRDQWLLQQKSKTALLFSSPQLIPGSTIIHIICGRTYAKQLINTQQLKVNLTWFDNEFAVNKQHQLIVCPYFDYRQLSNQKIERLATMINALYHLND